MINIILAIEDKKIYEEIEKEKEINIISKNVQYKEGILEVLEKNKNIQYIIFNENIFGQLSLEELLIKIKEKNNKIKIILILEKENIKKENNLIKIFNKNKIIFLLNDNLNKNIILEEIIKNKKIKEEKKEKENVVAFLGARGTGKTITILLLCKILFERKKVLIIGDTATCEEIKNLHKNDLEKEKNENRNIEIINIKIFFKNKKIETKKIINKIKSIKNNYDFIFIEIKNLFFYKNIKNLINKKILILNPNILEINKIKKINKYKINNLKIIFNNYNEKSIREKIIERLLETKHKIIGKIENNKNYTLVINNNMDISFLDNKTKKELNKIIERI